MLCHIVKVAASFSCAQLQSATVPSSVFVEGNTDSCLRHLGSRPPKAVKLRGHFSFSFAHHRPTFDARRTQTHHGDDEVFVDLLCPGCPRGGWIQQQLLGERRRCGAEREEHVQHE